MHQNFKCTHAAGRGCSCIDHPTAAGDCKELDHTDGTTVRVSDDDECADITPAPTPAPVGVLTYGKWGGNYGNHIKYKGYCYTTMDKCNPNLQTCGDACQQQATLMPPNTEFGAGLTKYETVPYSKELGLAVAQQAYFGTQFVVFKAGQAYWTAANKGGSLYTGGNVMGAYDGAGPASSATGNLRLLKGATFSYSGATVGLLEVYYRNPNGVGSWQPVCDDGFDATAAQVACKQLGMAGGSFETAPDTGRPNMHLDDLQCKGSEKKLMDCTHSGWGNENCGSGENVKLFCNYVGTSYKVEGMCNAKVLIRKPTYGNKC
jgi:hypothetical protein